MGSGAVSIFYTEARLKSLCGDQGEAGLRAPSKKRWGTLSYSKRGNRG